MALLETRLPPFYHLREVHLYHPLTSVWGGEKKSLSKAYNLDWRSTADCDYIYNSLFTEKWGVIFGLISAFWTQSPFLPQRCKAVKNQSSYSVLTQNWLPSWIAAFRRQGLERCYFTQNAFHCTPKSRASSHGQLHPSSCTQDSQHSALLLCPLLSLHHFSYILLVETEDAWAKLEFSLRNSLLRRQKRPWGRERYWWTNVSIECVCQPGELSSVQE